MAVENLDFEAPLLSLQREIEALTGYPADSRKDHEIARLQQKLDEMRTDIYARLTPWQKVQVARHPQRPYTLDFIAHLFTDFVELHGDRRFADDPAIVAGMAWFHGRPVVVVGHQKGRDTKQKIYRNFGMPRPEGYRKALRAMKLAEKFGRPMFCFVDTPGAYPGIDAEERGQAEAIAYNIREMARLAVPVIVTVTGEGGSGGALAIAIGDEILMLQHAIYSVISPEGCAAILWKDATRAEEAAEGLKLTSQDLLALGLIDRIVPEPVGGAHTAHLQTAQILNKHLVEALERIERFDTEDRLEARYQKFRRMGELGLETAAEP
ncbi:MAG TPA: acetyl-CoA carboxylase carboxyltransferase subunit alpha [Vicinamibacteria bacterium]|nr:acetyl-CoA carboxylase carboxyltransferase subunit alpha [Vicinamibacteria bacterium]